MQRRNLLIGMGSLTVGGAAAVGTGAFTSVEADRSVNVAVADDANAYLGLDDIDSSPNSQYIDTGGDQIVLKLDSTDNSGSGFNADAETRIDDLIRVSNQGTQTINVWVTLDDGNDSDEDTFDDDTLYFYPGDATDTALNNGQGDSDGDNVLGLTPGESADLGAFVDLGDVSSASESPTATFHADVDEGGSEPVDDSGGSFAVVAEDGSGDFSDLQTAIDNATGSTIAVKDTGTPLNVPGPLTINEDGLTIRGFNGKPTLDYNGGYPNDLAIKSTGANVTLESLQFEFNGNADGANGEKFSGSNSIVVIEGDETTVEDVDFTLVDPATFDTTGGLGFFNAQAASGVTVDGITSDIVDDTGTTLTGSDTAGGYFVSGARFVRNSTLKGGTRISTSGRTAATVKNNTIEDPAADSDAILLSGTNEDVLVKGNSIEYQLSEVGKNPGAGQTVTIKATGGGPSSTVNGQDVTGDPQKAAQILANANSDVAGDDGGVAETVILGAGFAEVARFPPADSA
jgi:hypothetical protein